MPEYAEIYVNVLILSKWLLFYFPNVIPCLPEGVVTCFSVYSKLEVLHGFYEDYEAVFLKRRNFIFSVVAGSIWFVFLS